jgi:two-component system chemotaxis response regulator CheB
VTGTVGVLIVERTAAARDALSALLEGRDGLHVLAVAADADAALAMVGRLTPQVVLLGGDLPGAAQLIRHLMSEHPTPVVVLVDPSDAANAGALMAEGAVSVQLRPREATAARRFAAVVAALAAVSVVRRRRQPGASRPASRTRAPDCRPPARMVAVAASTGGPVALQQLFGHLPADLPIPVVVVQHITSGFTAGLVASLQLGSPLPIRLATDGELLQPGTIYVAPDDRHLAVTRAGRARLGTGLPVSGFRPSASVLFSSLAAAYGPAAIAVVLTGMGTDGLSGLHEVHAAGGRILAQDEASSVVFGMPGAAVAAGIADVAAPVVALAAYIGRYANQEEKR